MAKTLQISGLTILVWILWQIIGLTHGDVNLVPRVREQKSNEYRIKRLIMRKYDKTTRPVKLDKTQITVNVAISLYHILDTNEKQQTFTCLLAIRQRWSDDYLQWNATEFGGVETVRIPANLIWTPDLVIQNFAGDKFNDFMVTNTIVNSDGSVLWLYPALITTYCTLNVKYFPFDAQHCDIIFISWTFSGFELDIVYNESFANSVYYVPDNQEWRVDGIGAERHEQIYACCPEPYPDVTFTIHMRRGSLFYIVNLIAPCFLIFLISFLGFFLPVESGEKVNLETTILLALVVFLLMVGETMPPTPDAIPILGMFFGCTMLMVSVALIMAVIVTNIYNKKNTFEKCPRCIVKLAKKYYPKYMKKFPPEDDMIHLSPLRPNTRWRKNSCNGGRPGDIMSITDGELESLTGDDCCGGHRRKRTSSGIKIGTKIPSHRGSLTQQQSFDRERNEAEWEMVSKFADRILFWVYAILSISIQAVLFIQMITATHE